MSSSEKRHTHRHLTRTVSIFWALPVLHGSIFLLALITDLVFSFVILLVKFHIVISYHCSTTSALRQRNPLREVKSNGGSSVDRSLRLLRTVGGAAVPERNRQTTYVSQLDIPNDWLYKGAQTWCGVQTLECWDSLLFHPPLDFHYSPVCIDRLGHRSSPCLLLLLKLPYAPVFSYWYHRSRQIW